MPPRETVILDSVCGLIGFLSADGTAGFLPAALKWLAPADLDATIADLRQTHRLLAARSLRGSWRVVPNSDHLIASSQSAAVIDAVGGLLADVR